MRALNGARCARTSAGRAPGAARFGGRAPPVPLAPCPLSGAAVRLRCFAALAALCPPSGSGLRPSPSPGFGLRPPSGRSLRPSLAALASRPAAAASRAAAGLPRGGPLRRPSPPGRPPSGPPPSGAPRRLALRPALRWLRAPSGCPCPAPRGPLRSRSPPRLPLPLPVAPCGAPVASRPPSLPRWGRLAPYRGPFPASPPPLVGAGRPCGRVCCCALLRAAPAALVHGWPMPVNAALSAGLLPRH